jgi:hypothetical protein
LYIAESAETKTKIVYEIDVGENQKTKPIGPLATIIFSLLHPQA